MLPNLLSTLRLALVPVVGWCILTGRTVEGGIFFALAAITDALDGFLARRLNVITPLGQILDPLADKALVNVATLSCAATGLLPLWFALVILFRDSIIVAAACLSRAFRLGHDLLPCFLGKLSAATQMMLLGIVLLPMPVAVPIPSIVLMLAFVATGLTVLSGLLYGLGWIRQLSRESHRTA